MMELEEFVRDSKGKSRREIQDAFASKFGPCRSSVTQDWTCVLVGKTVGLAMPRAETGRKSTIMSFSPYSFIEF